MNSLCTAIPVDIKLIQNPARHFWAGSRESRIQIWENQQVSISSYFYYRVQSWDFEIKKKGERRELGGMRTISVAIGPTPCPSRTLGCPEIVSIQGGTRAAQRKPVPATLAGHVANLNIFHTLHKKSCERNIFPWNMFFPSNLIL